MKAQSDKQAEKSNLFSSLQWVGMTEIQSAIKISDSFCIPVKVDIGVDLAENNRGIHMSRLYQLINQKILNQHLDYQRLLDFANQGLSSQEELSENFSARFKFEWPKATISLMSELSGFRTYPVQFIIQKNKNQSILKCWLQLEIIYSSTCPQSAGLAFEVLKQNQSTTLQTLPATPHAQRSRAVVQLMLDKLDSITILKYIDLIESSLKTVVQTTVKKADELQFAILNAENLMFCEDAARRISLVLNGDEFIKGYRIVCEHMESLHPHNATSLALKDFTQPDYLTFST